MKKLLGILGMALCLGFSAHAAESGKYGVGFVLGEPTALSGKYYQSKERAFDLQIAFNSRDFILIFGDYLYHFPGAFKGEEKFIQELSPYIGVGPLIGISSRGDHDEGQYFNKRDDKFALGVRVPFGIEWIWDRVPLGIGVELVPGIVVIPATTGFVEAGLTLRYIF